MSALMPETNRKNCVDPTVSRCADKTQATRRPPMQAQVQRSLQQA